MAKGHHHEVVSEEDAAFQHLNETERIELVSVGIDIGSATSHLVFSRIRLVRMGDSHSSRFMVVDRKCLYESDILLTPYVKGTTIDADALGRFVSESYRQAGIEPSAVDTGALILTGEAVRKRNARAIGDIFAAEAGRFVSVSAGDRLEAMMAAHGSGAVGESGRSERTIMSIDVGGGTAKIAIVKNGEILETAAMSVGSRLVVVDDRGVVTRLEEAGYQAGRQLGLDLRVGQSLSQAGNVDGHAASLDGLAGVLSSALFEVMRRQPLSPFARGLMRTPELSCREGIDAVIFSGGTSEYAYYKETRTFGDMGPALAQRLRAGVERMGIPVLEPAQRIRATVVGASQYTIQVSGNTIYVSDPATLPIRNCQVVSPRIVIEEGTTSGEIAAGISAAFTRFDLKEGERQVALALRWRGNPTFTGVDTVARGIAQGLSGSVSAGLPLVVVFDGDIAHLAGVRLAELAGPGSKVVSLDGIELRDFDFIDIGAVIWPAGAAPVVIKSLVFPTLSEWYGAREGDYAALR